ncbi:Protein of unknown function (DUF2922) [Desulfitobacterium dehalogenans ATCC 51507]|uniref:DUF2922 domain-containing protein n=1 Tax=Desulfitobacterium dehalogenans (strain ATCC 51507 / DSM 9161 / JW/IU-DC1) TaxID=756499 RepID=I4A9M8_DESDJ|nr:DUF2922 domain-containing protein [Desulfitobacterium dehalogenans]AFM00663.1 Protein of unknown function (DUF2922) [Desulfitobacterium dehalogenans ATCC 51507]
MPISTNRVIRLSFLTSGGKSAGITLSNPKQGLTQEVVQNVTENLYDPLEP